MKFPAHKNYKYHQNFTPMTPSATSATMQPEPNTNTTTAETFQYDVELNSLMSTLVNAVYHNKEVSIRELVSNSTDACAKFEAQYTKFKSEDLDVHSLSDMRIDLKIEKQSGKVFIVIKDNGIGMTKADLINSLGCVSSSGTKKFKQAFANASFDKGALDNLIGQFGIGFYSAFLIADQVKVITKHPTDKVYVWESKSLNEYMISEGRDEVKRHGTVVYLQVKSGAEKFASEAKLEEVLKKYSLFLGYPIYLHKEVEEEVEVEEEKVKEIKEDEVLKKEDPVIDEIKEDDKKEDDDKEDDKDKETKETKEEDVSALTKEDEEKKDEDKPVIKPAEKKKQKVKTVKPTLINKEPPLWYQSPKEIEPAKYNSFYKTLTQDWEDPLAYKHINLEGTVSISFLLFIPKKNKHSMFEKVKKDGIKIYSSNVCVPADLTHVIPDWMVFVNGVIASTDFPMNINRENIKGTLVMKTIEKKLVEKALEMICDLKGTDLFESFYKEYAVMMKSAVKDLKNENLKEKAAECLRFCSNKTSKEMSFDEYIERQSKKDEVKVEKTEKTDNDRVEEIKEDDDKPVITKESPELKKEADTKPCPIYILTGTCKQEVENSPYLKLFKDKEVLFMPDPMDEIWLQAMKSFKGHEFKRITNEDVLSDLKVSDDLKTSYESFTKDLKELVSDVSKIELKILANNEPAIISTEQYSVSPAYEKIVFSQPGAEENPFMSLMAKTKRVLILNPENEIIKRMKVAYESKDESWKSVANLVYETCLLGCGFRMGKVSRYVESVWEMVEGWYKPGESKGEEVL